MAMGRARDVEALAELRGHRRPHGLLALGVRREEGHGLPIASAASYP